MTDNEIIKTLECCSNGGSCKGCPCTNCEFEKDALDLINRQKVMIEKLEKIEYFADKTIEKQKAEIERLQHEILSCNTKIQVLQEVKEQLEKDVFNAQMNCDCITYEYELLKQEKSIVQSEAIKEFWEKVRKYIKNEVVFFTPQDEDELIEYGDNLVKEMTER